MISVFFSWSSPRERFYSLTYQNGQARTRRAYFNYQKWRGKFTLSNLCSQTPLMTWFSAPSSPAGPNVSLLLFLDLKKISNSSQQRVIELWTWYKENRWLSGLISDQLSLSKVKDDLDLASLDIYFRPDSNQPPSRPLSLVGPPMTGADNERAKAIVDNASGHPPRFHGSNVLMVGPLTRFLHFPSCARGLNAPHHVPF